MYWKKVTHQTEAGYKIPKNLDPSDSRKLLRATEAHREWLKHQAYADIFQKELDSAVTALPDHLVEHYLAVSDDLQDRHSQFDEVLNEDRKGKAPRTIQYVKSIYNRLMGSPRIE